MATPAILASAGAACGAIVTQSCRVWQEYKQIPDDLKRLERLCMACQVGCTCGNCKVEIGPAAAADAKASMGPAARERRLSAERRAGQAAIELEAQQCMEKLADTEMQIHERVRRIHEILGHAQASTAPGVVLLGPQTFDSRNDADECTAVVGHFTTDKDGRILTIDEEVERIVAMSAATMQESGYGWSAKLHPDDFRHVVALWITTTSQGRTFAARYRFQHPYETFHCFCICTPVVQEAVLIGYTGVLWHVSKETYNCLDV